MEPFLLPKDSPLPLAPSPLTRGQGYTKSRHKVPENFTSPHKNRLRYGLAACSALVAWAYCPRYAWQNVTLRYRMRTCSHSLASANCSKVACGASSRGSAPRPAGAPPGSGAPKLAQVRARAPPYKCWDSTKVLKWMRRGYEESDKIA